MSNSDTSSAATTTPKSVWRNPVHFLAFGLGSGAAPFAPGTFGTLAAVPLYLLMHWFFAPFLLVIVIAFSFIFGCWLCGKTAKEIGVHDHSGIVWDEFVGYWLTAFLVFSFMPLSWISVLASFVAFRIFDIVKPPPIKQLDAQLGGGLGIMLDDILAALYAAASIYLIYLVF